MKVLPAVMLITAAVVLIAAGCARQEEIDDSNGVSLDFTLYDLEGESVVLSELLDRGQKVILAFWTTWCPSCVQAIPQIEAFYQEHGGEVSLVSINIREEEAGVGRFAAGRGITYRIALDSDGSVAREFNVVGVPTYIVMEPDGEILYSGHNFGSAVSEAGF